ncbi:MAG: glycosyltransferase family 9 protein [Isosphaeraceae bacterium]|nr:glycosyltransferase family 9 protein [Isosphaeraceae bacterium]
MPSSLADLRSLEPNRVCLIKPSSLGDVVHTYPTLLALRDRWPRATIAWVVNRGLRGLVENHPAVDEVVEFDRAAITPGPRGLARFGRFLGGLKAKPFDVAIDAQGLLRSGLMAWATAAPVRVGLGEAREGATRFYTHIVPSAIMDGHAVVRTLRLAEAFGAVADPYRFVPALTDDDRRWARERLGALPRPLLVLNPGARWLTKRWPTAHFAAIARRAATERGAGIGIVGAPEDRPLVDAILAEIPGQAVLDLCGATSLPRLAAVAEASDLFLSNDTGPLHLAAATGANVLGIYLCTDPRRTGPFGRRAHAIQTGVWCASSCVRKCDRLECMSELDPDRVWPAVARILSSSSVQSVEAA